MYLKFMKISIKNKVIFSRLYAYEKYEYPQYADDDQ